MDINKNESQILEIKNIVIEIITSPYEWNIELDIVEESEMEARILQGTWNAALRDKERWTMKGTYKREMEGKLGNYKLLLIGILGRL